MKRYIKNSNHISQATSSKLSIFVSFYYICPLISSFCDAYHALMDLNIKAAQQSYGHCTPDIMNQALQQLLQQTSPQVIDKITTQYVSQLLAEKKYPRYNFRNTASDIRLSKLKNSETTLKVLRCLGSIFETANCLQIVDSELTQQFFRELALTPWKIVEMQLVYCRIGKNIATYLSILNLDNLQYLVIQSQQLNNLGVKGLMKIKMPNLEQIILSNTDITTECLKTLSKRTTYRQILVIYQRKFVSSLFLPTVMKLMNSQRKIIAVYPRMSKGQCVYLPHLSKTNFNKSSSPILILERDTFSEESGKINKSLMINQKANQLIRMMKILCIYN